MSKINRSTYQKVCEENKRLLLDIQTLVGKPSIEKVTVTEKWRSKFSQDSKLQKVLQQAATEYLKEHPEFDIKSPKYKSLKK